MPIRRCSLLVLASAVGVSLGLTRPAQAQPVDLGKITIPADFEHRTRVGLKGEYRLVLNANDLSLVRRDPVDGMEHSWGVTTTVKESKPASPRPTVDVAVVPAGGQPHVRIRVVLGGRSYTALLRVSDDKAPRPVVTGPLDPAVEIEIELVREAHAVLARYASRIWPGWTGYEGLEFLLEFPNRAEVIVTGRERVPQAFAALAAPPVNGKRVYVDLSNALPGRIGGPVSISAHGDISGVTASLIGPLIAPGTKTDPANRVAAGREDAARLARMLTYVHEAFHCLQADRFLQREKAGLNKPRGRPARRFDLTVDHNVHAEIEGEALLRASQAPDRAAAVGYLKDSFVARELKHQAMPEGAVVLDQLRTLHEGTATFANIKAAELVRDFGPPPAGGRDAEVLGAMYQHLDEYIRTQKVERLERARDNTDGTTDRYYIYGAYQAKLLDEISPGWQKGLLEQDLTLDDVLREVLALTPADRERAAERFVRLYEIDRIRARHSSILKAREDTIQAVRARTGRTFRIDLSRAQQGFDINPRPGAIFVEREQIYPHGLASFRYGSLRLVSKDTPMRLVGDILEWVDTEPAPGTKGYDLTYEARAGGVLKAVTLTTKGFTMTAKAVTIVTKGTMVTINVID